MGVFVAQLVDLANIPFLKGIDSGHYLPCVPYLRLHKTSVVNSDGLFFQFRQVRGNNG